MKLYYSPGFCSLVPHIVAREAGIELELQKVDVQAKAVAAAGDYWAINPKGYVPALLLDDGQVLTEVSALVQYLGERAPGSGLVPAAAMERYRMLEMLGYVSTEIHKGFDPLFNAAATDSFKEERREHLRKRYGLLEKRLGEGPYLLGEAFTAADAYLFVITGWSKYAKLDLSGFPNVLAFQKRVAARPAVQAAMRAEGLLQ